MNNAIKINLVAWLILINGTCIGSTRFSADEADMIHRAQVALTKVIIHDIFSPPVASRIYLYANMASYETVVQVQGKGKYTSLVYSIKGFPAIGLHSKKRADVRLASVYAYFTVARRFVFSERQLADSLNNILKEFSKIPKSVYKNSIEAGGIIADSIIRWAESDNYNQTRKLRRYTHSKEAGKWLPTPPGYIAAVEPNWRMMRTVVLDSASQFRQPPPPAFSIERESMFYREASEVYSVTKTMSEEQKEIAGFWDCNPFFINTQGHLNFATKKMSPGAHWILICGIACRKSGADLASSAAAYLLTSVAVYDGFISCWDEKYRSNVIRPETYINAYIDENWRPLLQTPPFPEYTSGHSVISTSAATALTFWFGEHFHFEDDSELDYGLRSRRFVSFRQAAQEASISRLYGGIHYRQAIENGQRCGELIGKTVVEKIRIRKNM